GLLLMAVTAGGFSTLTSCKDTDEDLRTELMGQQANLQAALDALKSQLEDCKNNCNTSITDIKNRLQALEGNEHHTETEIKGWITELTNKYATQEALNKLIERVEALENQEPGVKEQFTAEQVATLMTLITNAEAINGLIGENGTVANLADEIEALKKVLNGDGTNPGLIATVAGLEKWFEGIGITPAEFQNLVKQGQYIIDNKAALDALVKLQNEGTLNEEALKALNTYYNDLSKINEMYQILFPNGTEGEWWSYAETMQNIKDNTTAIAGLQEQIDELLGRLNGMVTSLLLQATTNPVFGSLNTPFGLNSMVLMSYYGHLATGLRQFPAAGRGAECYSEANDNIDWSKIVTEFYNIENENLALLNDKGQASLGNLWFTVNPGTVNTLDLDGFALVNSKDEVSKVNLTNITKDDDTVIKFGVNSTRAAGNGNGLYRAEASVAPEDLDAIKINIESGLKDALIDAVKNRTAADMAHMLKAIYNQLQNVCDANALRYTYETVSGKGDFSKVYSTYGLAATAFKPLSFATLHGESFKHIPTFNPIELDKSLVDLGLKPFKIGEVTLDIQFNIQSVKIDQLGQTVVSVKIPKKYDVDVDNNGEGEATLPEGWENNPEMYDVIDVDITDDLQAVVDQVQQGIDEWIYGVPGNENKPGLEKEIRDAISQAVDQAFNGEDGLIKDIEDQVNGMMGDIQDKLDSLVDKINSDYLNKVNTLINKYNSVANRINKVLDDPNHYLQSVMFYKNASGNLGFLSTNPNQPSQFKGNGQAIELWATTYNFETICPVFKKCIGVTKVTDQNGNDCPALVAAANNPANKLATVLNGDNNRVALNVAGATNGVYTYEIAYQALDYTGHTSTVKCYVQVVRN
ncbi:hypothetical protein, partial [uncultured Duncaniella sp.]